MSGISVNKNGEVIVNEKNKGNSAVSFDKFEKIICSVSLFDIEDWEIYIVYAFLKDKDKQVIGRLYWHTRKFDE